MSDYVTVAQYRNILSAEVAKGRLETEGVPVMLAGIGLGPLAGFFDPSTNDIRLRVPEEMAERARELLAVDWSEDVDDLFD